MNKYLKEIYDNCNIIDELIIYFKLNHKIDLIIKDFYFPKEKIIFILNNSIENIMELILSEKLENLKTKNSKLNEDFNYLTTKLINLLNDRL